MKLANNSIADDFFCVITRLDALRCADAVVVDRGLNAEAAGSVRVGFMRELSAR